MNTSVCSQVRNCLRLPDDALRMLLRLRDYAVSLVAILLCQLALLPQYLFWREQLI